MQAPSSLLVQNPVEDFFGPLSSGHFETWGFQGTCFIPPTTNQAIPISEQVHDKHNIAISRKDLRAGLMPSGAFSHCLLYYLWPGKVMVYLWPEKVNHISYYPCYWIAGLLRWLEPRLEPVQESEAAGYHSGCNNVMNIWNGYETKNTRHIRIPCDTSSEWNIKIFADGFTTISKEYTKEWFDDIVSVIDGLGSLSIITPLEYEKSISRQVRERVEDIFYSEGKRQSFYSIIYKISRWNGTSN